MLLIPRNCSFARALGRGRLDLYSAASQFIGQLWREHMAEADLKKKGGGMLATGTEVAGTEDAVAEAAA
jgi:hypothetical protein